MKPSDKFMHLTHSKICQQESGSFVIHPDDVIGWEAHKMGTRIKCKIQRQSFGFDMFGRGQQTFDVLFTIVDEFPHEVENEFNRAMS